MSLFIDRYGVRPWLLWAAAVAAAAVIALLVWQDHERPAAGPCASVVVVTPTP